MLVTEWLDGVPLGQIIREADQDVRDAVGDAARAMAAAGFTGKKGQACTVLAPSEALSRVVLIGLGKDADHTPR